MDVQLLPSDERCNRITHSRRAFDPSVSSVPSRPRSKRAEGEFVFTRALGATSCVGRQRCYRAVINVCSLGGDLETSWTLCVQLRGCGRSHRGREGQSVDGVEAFVVEETSYHRIISARRSYIPTLKKTCFQMDVTFLPGYMFLRCSILFHKYTCSTCMHTNHHLNQ